MSLQPIGYYLSQYFVNETQVGYRPVNFQFFLGRYVFYVVVLHELLWHFEEMYYVVPIAMLIISVIGVIRLVEMGSRSHDFDDELKTSFFLNYIFCGTFENVHFKYNFWFLHWWNILYFIWKFGTDSFNFIHTKCYLWSSIGDEDCPYFLK